MIMEKEIEEIKERLSLLEQAAGLNGEVAAGSGLVELDLVLPEADIGGLHFNETKVHGVFERKEDGNYYSRGILFLSARDVDDKTGRDLLSEYLDSEAVRDAFRRALGDEVRVFLHEENQGVKKYNGVSCWYWLRPRSSGYAAYFCNASANGNAHSNSASTVGGCAPAFRICREETP
jgi:hypothetical protein